MLPLTRRAPSTLTPQHLDVIAGDTISKGVIDLKLRIGRE
jgi:hypothetical protein